MTLTVESAYSGVGRRNSTRVVEGRKCSILLVIKMRKARTVVGRGGKRLLCDPGPELRLGGTRTEGQD